jgi:hypothetical protein
VAHSKSTNCKACGKPITILQQSNGGFCDDLRCRGPYLQQQHKIEKKKQFDLRRSIASSALQQLETDSPEVFQQTGLDPDQVLVLAVPHFEQPLEPMPEERRNRFANILDAKLKEALDELEQTHKHEFLKSQHANYHKQSSSLAIINACSTCRGECCKQGGDHAFLVPEYLAWRMLEEPELTPEAIKDQYLALIPEQHYAASCLFQSPLGCVIPRSLRGPTCNWFICDGIADFRAEIEADPDQPTIAVANLEGNPTRIGLMNAGGERVEIDVQA